MLPSEIGGKRVGQKSPVDDPHSPEGEPIGRVDSPSQRIWGTFVRAVILAVVMVALVAAAGCSAAGGSDEPQHLGPSPTISMAPASSRPTVSPAASSPGTPGVPTTAAHDRTVLDAVAAVAAAETFRFHMRLDITGASADEIVQLADGQTATGDPRRSNIRLSLEDRVGGADMIHDTDAIYLRGPGFENQTGPGKWLIIDLDSDDPRMAEPIRIFAHSLDPRPSIYLLFGAKNVEARGAEVIDGQDTSAFTMTIDARRALETAPDDVAAVLESASERPAAIECDVWIDGHGLVRRMQYTNTWGQADGRQTIETSIDLFAFGEPLDLAVPEPDDTVLYGTPLD